MNATESLVPVEKIERRIFLFRRHKVMLDSDLAEIFGTTTKRLNEQVRRNKERFPEDFMFQLTKEEAASLRSHSATSKQGRGGRRYAPYAFTEHGAVMLASVLNTPVAVQASIQVVRAFVRLRQMLGAHEELAKRLEEMEKKYDAQFRVVFDAVRHLMADSESSGDRIGFRRP